MNPKKPRPVCLCCGIPVSEMSCTYCSIRCQADFAYKRYIKNWKAGKASGTKKDNTLSNHVRKYLLEKANYKCALCGWEKINPVTRKSPLEIDHIDGNHLNNKEINLRVLCPNCHSLTPTYKALNKGNGRKSRRNAPIAQLARAAVL